MTTLAQDLRHAVTDAAAALATRPKADLARRPAPGKWSPLEILGHLVDSALHNLVRLTEAPLAEGPYRAREYDQDALVRVNEYQQADLDHLLTVWVALNAQLGAVLERYSPAQLASAVELPDGTVCDVGAVASGYVAHLRHHLRQLGITA